MSAHTLKRIALFFFPVQSTIPKKIKFPSTKTQPQSYYLYHIIFTNFCTKSSEFDSSTSIRYMLEKTSPFPMTKTVLQLSKLLTLRTRKRKEKMIIHVLYKNFANINTCLRRYCKVMKQTWK
jgi:endoglucanase Acf2